MSDTPAYAVENDSRYERTLRKFLRKYPELRERCVSVVRRLLPIHLHRRCDYIRCRANMRGSGRSVSRTATGLPYDSVRSDALSHCLIIGSHGEVYGRGDDD